MNAYVLLALLSEPKPDLGKATEIVNWLSKQQNPYGGFSSTQVTDNIPVHYIAHCHLRSSPPKHNTITAELW